MAPMLNPRPRDFTETSYMSSRSDQQLFAVIQQGSAALGLSAGMPAFDRQLTVPQTWDVVAYVRALAQSVPGAAATASQPAASAGAPLTGVTISRLRLSIWPEYDDPRVLIILRGEMSPRQAFPGTLTLPVPPGADIIGAGIISDQNELLVQPYEIGGGQPLDSLHLQLSIPRFFVEFYYNPFTANTPEKRLTYSASFAYPIELLEVDIQQPLQAQAFRVEPPAMERRTDTQQFTYHQYVYRDIPPGQERAFQIVYSKTTSAPSVAKTPAAASPGAARQPVLAPGAWLSLAILAGAVLIVGGWAWLLRHHLRPQPATQAPRAAASSLAETLALLLRDESAASAQAPSTPVPETAGVANFCTYCGQKLQQDGRFCGACGKPIAR